MKSRLGLQIVLVNILFVVSGSMMSLSFLEDYMELYRLKDPLFVLTSDDLDEYYLKLQNTSFEKIACICYDQGSVCFETGIDNF